MTGGRYGESELLRQYRKDSSRGSQADRRERAGRLTGLCRRLYTRRVCGRAAFGQELRAHGSEDTRYGNPHHYASRFAWVLVKGGTVVTNVVHNGARPIEARAIE